MVERPQPQGRDEPRRSEGLAVQKAEDHAREPRSDHER